VAIGSECYRFSNLEVLPYTGILRESQELNQHIPPHKRGI